MTEHNRPSLYDLLTLSEEPQSASAIKANYLKSVREDIIHLLNASNIEAFTPTGVGKEASASSLNYGTPNYAGYTAAALVSDLYKKSLRQALIRFEPRLIASSIQLEFLQEPEFGFQNHDLDRYESLRLKLEAEVYQDPLPLHLIMESELAIDDGRLRFIL